METDWVLKGTKKAKKHRNPMCVCRIQRALLFWPVGSIGPKPINGPHTKQEQRTLSGKKGIVVKKEQSISEQIVLFYHTEEQPVPIC